MTTITLFGCGAIGSQLAMHLASEDIRFVLVDDDRVAENNIATSSFTREQVDLYKANALANLLYRKAKCYSIYHFPVTLDEKEYKLRIKYSDFAIDCFDNVDARRITCKHLVPTLHIGVSRDGTGSITWDEHYILFDGAPRGEDQFCTHLAGKNIIRLTACVSAHIVEQWLATGRKESLVITDRLTILR